MKKQVLTISEKIFNLCVESAKNSKSGYTFDLKEVWQAARLKYKMNKASVQEALTAVANEHEIKLADEEGKFHLLELMPKPSKKQMMYNDFKKTHPDSILLFRCGDFYETYESDAIEAARILGITLTYRSDKGQRWGDTDGAVAGFPHFSLDAYLPKLIRSGKKVAIIDELKEPAKVVKPEEPKAEEVTEEKKVWRGYGRDLTECEIVNLKAQAKARALYPEQFKRFGFARFDSTNSKEYKNVGEAKRNKADMNNLLYMIKVVDGVQFTGSTRINAYENFLNAR